MKTNLNKKYFFFLLLTFIKVSGQTIAPPISISVIKSDSGGNYFSNMVTITSSLNFSRINTGILYERCLPLAPFNFYNGSTNDSLANFSIQRQIYRQLIDANINCSKIISLDSIDKISASKLYGDTVPFWFLDIKYNEIKDSAVYNGLLGVTNSSILIDNN
ncbi:MAG: hypothetical protein JSU07_07505 [Bacteroidetes bacterium]|nr:hypothetical protein [Bacteroidota bacterium]